MELAYLASLAAVEIFTVASAILVYVPKSIMRSAVALALAFFGGSIAMLFAMQSFLALLQLLVFVGGISAYFIIALSLENEKNMSTKRTYFLVLAVGITLSLFAMFLASGGNAIQPQYPNSFVSSFMEIENNSYYFLYLVAFTPFAGAIGGIIIIKRLRHLA
ncbi:MAG: NADH-quinone oxidoreductase subunit J [Candidatus Micrarchaeia archaeon]|jgi:NADH:ubiquinone oxidoreductase subunit 6 (subunit J)